MEELKQLEKAQRAIHLMHSQGFVSSHSKQPHSYNFLVNFIHFLAQPCGHLDMETKCQLIYENLPGISTVFLQESESCSKDEGSGKHNQGTDSLRSDYKIMAMVGLEAMQDANSTLGDFCRSYFMFHDMDVNKTESIFRYLPILSFTESYIYQLDRLNEKTVNLPDERAADLKRCSHKGLNERWHSRSLEQLKTNPFRPLALLLQHHQILTDRIEEEFTCGQEYWGLERKLCAALACNEEILVEDVMRAVHLKSFDYRVLNLILYQLRGQKVNELHMQFLSVSEFLVELSDDLFDYEDDVLENNFNVLRMYVRIFGASAAPTMLAKCITEAEAKYERLLRDLGPHLADNYKKRCEEATKEGGKITGPSLGTWTIPPIIQDEDNYKKRCKEATKEGGKITGPSLGTWTIPPIIQDEDTYRSVTVNI